MALVTLTITDINLPAGTYKVDFKAVGNEIDDGQATAAYFTGFYLNTIVNTPDFLSGVVRFGRAVIDGMTRAEPHRPMTNKKARMVLTLSDKDIETGRFATTIENEGGDPTGESLPTTAQIVGTYMRSLVTDADFMQKVWAFAEEFVANHEGSEIANSNYLPAADAA